MFKRFQTRRSDYAKVQTKLRPRLTHRDYLTLSFLSETICIVLKKILGNRSNLRVLDVGCGRKPYEVFFKHGTDAYIGIDINRGSSAEIVGIGEKLPFKDNYFDIALSIQVLEHVIDPLMMLKEIHRVCKNSGFLVLSTHGIYLEDHGPNDLWRYTSQGLAKLVQSTGFKVINVYSMSPLESLVQISLFYFFLPDPLNLFNAIGNVVGKTLKSILGNVGPKLHIIHLILAEKQT